jgi:hypothetical protein
VTGTCVYCGEDLADYEPIYVEETRGGDRVELGGFCNYGCLSAHVDEAGLAEGACCSWSPE